MGEVAAAEDQLRRTGEFIADVAHELRTPLASIKAYSEVLIDQLAEGDTASASQFLGIINAETDRLADLIADLLDLASLETGRVVLQPTPIDLAGLVLEATDAARVRGREVDAEAESTWVDADADLAQRLVNSVVGAVAALGEEGSRIRVTLRRAGDGVELTAHGDDATLTPEELNGALDKFYRGRAGSAIRKMGLRLPLARQIAQAHGGSIAVESAEGAGTTVRVRLPAMAQ